MSKELERQTFTVKIDGLLVSGTRDFWVEHTSFCPPSEVAVSLDLDEVEFSDDDEDTFLRGYLTQHGKQSTLDYIENNYAIEV